jgi:hypothetical protein
MQVAAIESSVLIKIRTPRAGTWGLDLAEDASIRALLLRVPYRLEFAEPTSAQEPIERLPVRFQVNAKPVEGVSLPGAALMGIDDASKIIELSFTPLGSGVSETLEFELLGAEGRYSGEQRLEDGSYKAVIRVQAGSDSLGLLSYRASAPITFSVSVVPNPIEAALFTSGTEGPYRPSEEIILWVGIRDLAGHSLTPSDIAQLPRIEIAVLLHEGNEPVAERLLTIDPQGSSDPLELIQIRFRPEEVGGRQQDRELLVSAVTREIGELLQPTTVDPADEVAVIALAREEAQLVWSSKLETEYDPRAGTTVSVGVQDSLSAFSRAYLADQVLQGRLMVRADFTDGATQMLDLIEASDTGDLVLLATLPGSRTAAEGPTSFTISAVPSSVDVRLVPPGEGVILVATIPPGPFDWAADLFWLWILLVVLLIVIAWQLRIVRFPADLRLAEEGQNPVRLRQQASGLLSPLAARGHRYVHRMQGEDAVEVQATRGPEVRFVARKRDAMVDEAGHPVASQVIRPGRTVSISGTDLRLERQRPVRKRRRSRERRRKQ